jgi:hypothetical protein
MRGAIFCELDDSESFHRRFSLFIRTHFIKKNHREVDDIRCAGLLTFMPAPLARLLVARLTRITHAGVPQAPQPARNASPGTTTIHLVRASHLC